MADTDLHHHHTESIPVESDGISYKGLIWFTAFLAGAALVIHVLMWVAFEIMERRNDAAHPPRAVMANPSLQRPPGPNLMAEMNPQTPTAVMGPSEPVNLQMFRETEDQQLTTYGWLNESAGTVRIPIERAKQLLLQRGLKVRGQTPAPAPEVGK
jgi:hypothetical protein